MARDTLTSTSTGTGTGPLARLFTDHPAAVDETYAEHFRVASKVSGQLLAASAAAAVHAVVPAFCQTTASRRVCELYQFVTAGHRAAVTAEYDCNEMAG